MTARQAFDISAKHGKPVIAIAEPVDAAGQVVEHFCGGFIGAHLRLTRRATLADWQAQFDLLSKHGMKNTPGARDLEGPPKNVWEVEKIT